MAESSPAGKHGGRQVTKQINVHESKKLFKQWNKTYKSEE